MKKTFRFYLRGLAAILALAGVSSARTSAYYEAEDAMGKSGCAVSKANFPYIGAGYLVMGGASSYVEWTNINAPAAGYYTLNVKFANASGNKQCELRVNDSIVKNIPFTSYYPDVRHYWNARATVDLTGGNNTIRLTANTPQTFMDPAPGFLDLVVRLVPAAFESP